LQGPWGFQQHYFLLVLRGFLPPSFLSFRVSATFFLLVLKDCLVLRGFLQWWLLLQLIIFGVVVKMLNGTKNKVSAFTRGRTLGKRYGIKVWCCFLLGTYWGQKRIQMVGSPRWVYRYWVSNRWLTPWILRSKLFAM